MVEELAVKKFKSIKRIKSAVAALYGENSYPFQSYATLYKASDFFARIKSIRKSAPFKGNYLFYLVCRGREPIIMVPVRIRTDSEAELLGSSSFDFTDSVYCVGDKKVIAAAYDMVLDSLRREYKFEKLVIRYCPSDSVTAQVFKESFGAEQTVYDNMKIDFGDDYEAYLKTLSKSVRQNIRTAVNRIVREGGSYGLKIFLDAKDNRRRGRKLYKKSMKFCIARQKKKYGCNTLSAAMNYKYFNYVSRCAFNKNAFGAYLMINGKVAAFMIGFIDENRKSLQVPRLALNEQFAFYSPGMLLCSETVKYLIEHTGYRTLDLCRGTENYKSSLGGQLYETYGFTVNLK